MSGQRYRRIDERDRGRQRLSRLTGWIAAAAVALAGVFGLALARHDQAAAATVNQNQVTDDNGDNGGVVGNPDSGGGGVIQPPAQPPVQRGGRGHVSSGGS